LTICNFQGFENILEAFYRRRQGHCQMAFFVVGFAFQINVTASVF
jgi:hypothetical protein